VRLFFDLLLKIIMLNLFHISTLVMCLVSPLLANTTIAYQEAKSTYKNATTEAFSLKVNDKIYVKSGNNTIIISFDNLDVSRKNKTLTESCFINSIFINQKQIIQNSFPSSIIYDVEKTEKGSSLTRKQGTQKFTIDGIDFSWSHSDDNTIFIYVPLKTSYVLLKANRN